MQLKTGRTKTPARLLPAGISFFIIWVLIELNCKVQRRKARGQRLAAARVFTIEQLINYRDSKLTWTLAMANTMQNDVHLEAARFHQLAVQACRDGAAHHVRKGITWPFTGTPKQAMAQAIKVLKRSQGAHRKSV